MGHQQVKECAAPSETSKRALTVPVLAELETCSFRNKTPEETAAYMAPLLDKHLPLHSNASRSSELQRERRTDHYSHFILRLAFATTEDLRRRFSRLETALFRLRYRLDDARERAEFTAGLSLGWEAVGERERGELAEELRAAGVGMGRKAAAEDDGYFKVDWERVPELVEGRKVLLKRGVAYVPVREQISLVVPEFTKRLDEALEVRSAPATVPIHPDGPR